MNDDFRIRFGGEAMALGDQGGHQFNVVVDFAIEDDTDGAILVVDRLITPGQVDDAQPAIAKAHVVANEVPVAVRAAMPEGRRHSPQDVFVNPRSAIRNAYAADTTHIRYL